MIITDEVLAKDGAMSMLKIAIHPGRILQDEFLEPMGLSAGQLAKHVGVPRTRIERLVKEDTAVTVDTAMRLARVFGTTPEFWMNLQTRFDLARINPGDFSSIQPVPSSSTA